jgi:DNA-directed RNA polymerase specialized sigma24 family protein
VNSSPPGAQAPDAVAEAATTRLSALWDAHAVRVQAYAMRHTDADTAQDVLSETFLVAWRRLDDVPENALPWLLVVARNIVRNLNRTRVRARLLEAELTYLQAAAPSAEGAPETLATERDLHLVAWDGLAPAAAALIADCSTAAFHVRLHRARRRLAALVGDPTWTLSESARRSA